MCFVELVNQLNRGESKMKKLLFAALSTALLAGCAPTPKQINIPYQFDSNQAKKQLEPGSETLQGNAFLRQVGGGDC